MLFPIKVNAAIAATGIPPNAIPGHIRQRGQDIGKRHRLTPQETALVIIAECFGVGYPTDSSLPLAVETWIAERKVNTHDPRIMQVLEALHLA